MYGEDPSTAGRSTGERDGSVLGSATVDADGRGSAAGPGSAAGEGFSEPPAEDVGSAGVCSGPRSPDVCGAGSTTALPSAIGTGAGPEATTPDGNANAMSVSEARKKAVSSQRLERRDADALERLGILIAADSGAAQIPWDR
jgi:hypothetical protein